jgi:hypothetical protein
MWALWCLQKDTHRPASQILGINQWALETTGLDGWWAGLQLDRAVSWVGRYIESKLSEIEDGEPVHSLSDLLDTEDVVLDGKALVQHLSQALGVVNT